MSLRTTFMMWSFCCIVQERGNIQAFINSWLWRNIYSNILALLHLKMHKSFFQMNCNLILSIYALCHQFQGLFKVLHHNISQFLLSLEVSLSCYSNDKLPHLFISVDPSTPPTPTLTLGTDKTFSASIYPTDERFGPIR